MNHMDKASWLGLVVGFGAILLGNVIEGGHMSSLMQFTAALIVLGGTIGAVMVSSPEKDLKKGIQLFKSAFRSEDKSALHRSMTEIVDCARLVRKENLLSLEKARLSDPFVGRVVRNAMDGIDPQMIREIGEAEIDREEEELLAAVKIWNDAGGFAPTIGIIGAVLGLIHVMGNLSDTSKLGAGIAVAFVATVYGVGFSNLLFLPIANKLKKKVLQQARERRILLEGALLVGSDLNPLIIERKLKASLEQSSPA
ncbi:MAG: flagellar motor protein [Bdellovibrionaceae bacterium]|nr:flagellar motor protein [Pseudobdellovibrionaceae bacterium]